MVNLFPSVTLIPLSHVRYSQVPGFRMRTSLGALFCLPQCLTGISNLTSPYLNSFSSPHKLAPPATTPSELIVSPSFSCTSYRDPASLFLTSCPQSFSYSCPLYRQHLLTISSLLTSLDQPPPSLTWMLTKASPQASLILPLPPVACSQQGRQGVL